MTNSSLQRSSKPVANWLLLGVGMIIVQILLGGITRLTGSGLSITEWDVITGTLPPLNEQEWMNAFEKYQHTSQYRYINFDFTLSDFKFIYFWEWLHRLWARLIGIVFAVPFMVFLIQRRFRNEMIKSLIILFLLGALQGAVGWIMVVSGLTGDALYVRPAKLALHFVFALGLLCYTFWFALKLLVKEERRIAFPSLRRFTWVLISVLTLQLIFGAVMAGHKAAIAAPTWPDINGSFIPQGVFSSSEGLLMLIENKITIHFMHRMLAYLLLVLIIIWLWKAGKVKGNAVFTNTKWLPLLLVLIQILLGIFSVLASVKMIPADWGAFEWLAQLHQLVAMFLLLSLVWMLFLLKTK